ncbi:hypothetical protein GCM10010423_29820 [Streptomyces levis]|uniref:Transposase n=1 Tax=Streptomyces levis TaxID=285566 RepID=A0ABN3NVP8_9ACTN
MRTAAAIDDIHLGLHRSLRKIRHDFSRATARSTGARAAGGARLMVCWVGVRSPPGGLLRCRHPWTDSHVGTVGQDRDALALTNPDDPVGAGRGRVVDRRGRAGEIRSSSLTTSCTVGRGSSLRWLVEPCMVRAGVRELIVAEYRVTGLSPTVIAELIAEVGPLWHAQRQARLTARPRRRAVGAGAKHRFVFVDRLLATLDCSHTSRTPLYPAAFKRDHCQDCSSRRATANRARGR